jgi:hypothetical protein
VRDAICSSAAYGWRVLTESAAFLEAKISLPVIHWLTDDYVVQQLDLENPGSLANPAGEAQIGFTRARVSGGMVVLCEQNGYVNRRAYRRAQAVVGVARIDQTLHIICCGFSSQTAGFD